MFIMHESVLGQQAELSFPHLQASPLLLRFLSSSGDFTPKRHTENWRNNSTNC